MSNKKKKFLYESLNFENPEHIEEVSKGIYEYDGKKYLVLTKDEAVDRAFDNFLELGDMADIYAEGRFSMNKVSIVPSIDEVMMQDIVKMLISQNKLKYANKLIETFTEKEELRTYIKDHLFHDSYDDMVRNYLFKEEAVSQEWQLIDNYNSNYGSEMFLIYQRY